MRRFLLLTALMLLLLFSCGREETEDRTPSYDNFIYTVCEGYIRIDGYRGTETEIVFPSEIGGLPVTEIAENAFRGCTGLKKIVLPGSVRKISSAFIGCRSLETAELGGEVVEMESAFCRCDSLKTVTGYRNAEILAEAFKGCASLREGIIPSSAVTCRDMFGGCTSLIRAEVENGVGVLDGTFAGCTSLVEITLPVSVTELCLAFTGCVSLKTVNGTETVQIFRDSFVKCTSLERVNVGSDVTEMSGAFVGCTSLKAVSGVPGSLEIYAPCYSGCKSIDYIFIPDITGVNARESYDLKEDFVGCESLEVVSISGNIMTQDDFGTVFGDCVSLKTVNCSDEVRRSLTSVGYSYTDEIYEGDDIHAVNLFKLISAQKGILVQEGYAEVNGESWSLVTKGIYNDVRPAEVLASIDAETFVPYTETSYWIGMPDGTSEKMTVMRKWYFDRVTTGYVREGMRPSVFINGDEYITG